MTDDIDTLRKFYSQIGYAVTMWANVDHAIFLICKSALGLDDRMTAAIYYGSDRVSEHLALATRVLALRLDASGRRDWKRLADSAQVLSSFRNRLAHDPPRFTSAPVAFRTGSDGEVLAVSYPGADHTASGWFSLYPEPLAPRRGRKPRKRKAGAAGSGHAEISLGDITAHIGAVDTLLDRLADFLRQLERRPAPKSDAAPA